MIFSQPLSPKEQLLEGQHFRFFEGFAAGDADNTCLVFWWKGIRTSVVVAAAEYLQLLYTKPVSNQLQTDDMTYTILTGTCLRPLNRD
jgi:hypothetical protein